MEAPTTEQQAITHMNIIAYELLKMLESCHQDGDSLVSLPNLNDRMIEKYNLKYAIEKTQIQIIANIINQQCSKPIISLQQALDPKNPLSSDYVWASYTSAPAYFLNELAEVIKRKIPSRF